MGKCALDIEMSNVHCAFQIDSNVDYCVTNKALMQIGKKVQFTTAPN